MECHLSINHHSKVHRLHCALATSGRYPLTYENLCQRHPSRLPKNSFDWFSRCASPCEPVRTPSCPWCVLVRWLRGPFTSFLAISHRITITVNYSMQTRNARRGVELCPSNELGHLFVTATVSWDKWYPVSMYIHDLLGRYFIVLSFIYRYSVLFHQNGSKQTNK